MKQRTSCLSIAVASVAIIAALSTACSSTSEQVQTQTTEPGLITSTTGQPSTSANETTTSRVTTTEEAAEPLVVGAANLAASGFESLDGQRVGVIANHTALVDGRHLVDLFHEAPNVELVAVFAPEHGFRGTGDAGETQSDQVDAATGATVLSIYGATKAPTPAMLEGIDVLVYDIQDVGARFYTFISTLGLSMQAAAEAEISVVVLDRPNPNPGPSAGPTLEPSQRSFIGQYEIPSTYGLTVGELALAIKGEQLIDGLDDLDLTVVPMTGWDDRPLWGDNVWVAPSPGLPMIDGARLYPGTVLFEATTLSWGRGTDNPFEQVGAPWLDATAVADSLNDLAATTPELQGATFEATSFTPERLDYMTGDPQFSGQTLPAIRVTIDDPAQIEPVALGVYLLAEVIASPDGQQVIDRAATFDLLAGTSSVRQSLLAGVPAAEIVASWSTSARAFDTTVEPYRLYGD